jgi:hypothetical protein
MYVQSNKTNDFATVSPLKNFIYFICSLFKDAFSVTVYIASSEG